jgi:hypothetical protein
MSLIYARVKGTFDFIKANLNSYVPTGLPTIKQFLFGGLAPSAFPACLIYTDQIKPEPVENNRCQSDTIIMVHLVHEPKSGTRPDPEGDILQLVDAVISLWSEHQQFDQSDVVISEIGDIDVAGGQVAGSLRAEALITLHLHTYG